MYCTQCGTEQTAKASYCHACGKPLRTLAEHEDHAAGLRDVEVAAMLSAEKKLRLFVRKNHEHYFKNGTERKILPDVRDGAGVDFCLAFWVWLSENVRVSGGDDRRFVSD